MCAKLALPIAPERDDAAREADVDPSLSERLLALVRLVGLERGDGIGAERLEGVLGAIGLLDHGAALVFLDGERIAAHRFHLVELLDSASV